MTVTSAELFDVVGGDPVLRVHVQPGAGRPGVAGRHGDALKLKVSAPPVDGRANEAAARLLADLLGLKVSQVVLESGATSRSKRFRVSGLGADELSARLAHLGV